MEESNEQVQIWLHSKLARTEKQEEPFGRTKVRKKETRGQTYGIHFLNDSLSLKGPLFIICWQTLVVRGNPRESVRARSSTS